METQTIYIPLSNEGTEVWRPVTAEFVSDALFRIVSQSPEHEEWAFTPGQVVAVREHSWEDGHQGLVAIRAASETRIDVNADELRLINNALNEVCNGLDLKSEFENRLGASLQDARSLLDRISKMIP